MIVIKEEFVGGEKWRRAAKLGRSDAIVMWVALKCYVSKHPSSEGFIADEDIDALPGVPPNPRKALAALVACGRRGRDGTRGAGLVEPAPGGWQLHDYLDHATLPEDEELRREKARLKKQLQRAEKKRELESVRRSLSRDVSPGQTGDNGGQSEGDSGGDTDEDVPGTSLAGARPPAPAHVDASARSQPNPTQPNPGRELPDARAQNDAGAVARTTTMPSKEPPKEYLDECRIAGVKHERAVATWSHYYGAGLPQGGVERLIPWMVQRAKEKATREERVEARPRPMHDGRAALDDPGIRGYQRVEPQSEHRQFAAEHDLKLDDFVARLNADPRTKKLSTVEAWGVLTKVLEAAARRKNLDGAA